MRILVACSSPADSAQLLESLVALGHEPTAVSTAAQALAIAFEERFSIVMLDTQVPGGCFETLSRFRQQHPQVDVLLTARHANTRDVVRAVQAGATDYLTSPMTEEDLRLALQRVSERRSAANALLLTQERTSIPIDKYAILGQSPPMVRMFQQLERLAPSDASVLVRGESGTGKELVARFIHQRGSRAGGPFVAINCAALPDALIESELFGHERGAFTGAVQRRVGRFRQADRGTLFLDEIAELPLASQAKLLRVLQDGEVEPVGGSKVTTVDVRVISATHRDLKERVRSGLFRDDLYYRLKVLELQVPPLRTRVGDLSLLVNHFLNRFAPPGSLPRLTSSAWAALASYDFPGNVRELQHAIQHAVVMAGDEDIDVLHLPDDLLGSASVDITPEQVFTRLSDAVRGFEASYIERTLAATDGNRTRAAEVLGISRKNLWEKMRAFGLE